MLKVDIPGFGLIELMHLVTDFTGTLSVDGRLLPEVREKLVSLTGKLKVHVLTSDTYGTARQELAGIDCTLHILEGTEHDVQKEAYVDKLGSESVVAFGNGRNDCLMLRLAKLGISVSQGEGCSTSALLASDIMVTSAADGLGLLAEPTRAKATLRF